MKVNLDTRNLKQGRYIIFILSTQITLQEIKYADNYTEATEISDKYEQIGYTCIITRVLNNTLSKSDKWTYND